MENKNINNDTKTQKEFKICNICGCTIKHPNNFKRHLRSKRHNEVDYRNNNRFELERIFKEIKECKYSNTFKV